MRARSRERSNVSGGLEFSGGYGILGAKEPWPRGTFWDVSGGVFRQGNNEGRGRRGRIFIEYLASGVVLSVPARLQCCCGCSCC